MLTVQRAQENGGGGGGPAKDQRTYVRDPKGTSTGGQFTAQPKAAQSQQTPSRPAKASTGSSGTNKTSTNKTSTKPAAKTSTKPKPKPKPRSSSSGLRTKTPPAMRIGGDNDPKRVADLQRLVNALGLGPLDVDGKFGDKTAAQIRAVQERLGLKPTGTASQSLINKMLNAYDLSPCVKKP